MRPFTAGVLSAFGSRMMAAYSRFARGLTVVAYCCVFSLGVSETRCPVATRDAATSTRLDTAHFLLRVGDSSFAVTYDALPLPGIRGLPFPQRADTPPTRVVFGGRLGEVQVLHPRDAAETIVVLLPPLRSDGDPDYQVWAHVEMLRPYRDAAALLVVSLDLTPLSFVDSLVQWHTDPSPSVRAESPPIVIITRAAASALVGDDVGSARPGASRLRARLRFRIQSRP